jgi:hypothetical protein
MAGDLVVQLRERTDLRNLQVVVRRFEDRTRTDKTFVKRNRVYFAKGDKTPEEFRQELIEALSPHVRVVDRTASVQQPAPSGDWGNPTRDALLEGEYTADAKHTVYLRARVVDAESRVVLATAEGIVRK